MPMLNDVMEHIAQELYGSEKPFECRLFNEKGNVVLSKRFQTENLAWAYGANWKMLSGYYHFEILERRIVN